MIKQKLAARKHEETFEEFAKKIRQQKTDREKEQEALEKKRLAKLKRDAILLTSLKPDADGFGDKVK